MKKTFLLKTLLLLCALVVEGTTSAWADEYTYTFNASSGVGKGDNTLNSILWTIGHDSEYQNNEATGFHVGSSSKSLSYLELSTSGISGTISKIVVNAKGNGSGGTINVSVNDTAYSAKSNDKSITNSFKNFEFTGNQAGTIVIRLSYSNKVTKNFYVASIAVTYSTAEKHTLGWSVNPVSTGTVSLGATSIAEGSTTTITATPNDGYRFVDWSVSGTGSSVTNTTSASTTFVMGTADATVTANFEAIPTHTLSSVADPVDGGTIDLGATSVREGATTTATASSNAGYKFTGWSISGTGASLSSTSSNPTTVTMGTADATVTANFEAVDTHEIKWSVNGVIVKTENVEENTAIDFAAPTSGVPVGYVFKGWVIGANRIDGATDIAPSANYVTSANSTEDITYYAVMAVLTSSGPDTYEKLTSNAFETSATYVLGGDQLSTDDTKWYLYSYENVDQNSNWGVCTDSPVDNTPVYFKLSGTSTALVAKDNSGNYIKGLSTGKFYMASTSQNIYLTNNGQIRVSSDGYYLRHNYNSGNGGLRWYSGSTGTPVYFFKVISGDVYKNFCTSATIPATIPATMGNNGYTTFANVNALDLEHLPSGLTAYKAGVTGSTVTFTEINDQAVPANTGLLLKGGAGLTYNIPVAASGTDVTGNAFMVNTAGTTFTGDDNYYYFGLKKNTLTFGLFDPASVAIPANKAYLKVSKSAGARELTVLFDDEATGIEDLTPALSKGERVVYDLSGRRVVTPTKGLYIVNGKKVVVK